jgi:malate permease and related proteins
LSELLNIFLNNILPVFLASGAGYLLSHFMDINPRSLSRVIFYIFSPCLVFSLLTQSTLSGADIWRMMLFTATSILLVGALTWIACKLLKFQGYTWASVMITSMFMNAGNFGLPVVLFAFGETAQSYASVFFVTNALLAYTLGAVIASLGQAGLKQAISELFKAPMVYALLAAVIFLGTGWKIPLPVGRTITLLGSASVPAMLVLLGMQFKTAGWTGKTVPLLLTGGMRLLVSPLVTLLLAPVFGIFGPARQASILEAAMPTAVLTTMLATEYNVEPSLVTAVVFVTTLLSPLTLTPLLAYLGA